METDLSDVAVARMGRVGCGADCHARVFEGGESVARWVRTGVVSGIGTVDMVVAIVVQGTRNMNRCNWGVTPG